MGRKRLSDFCRTTRETWYDTIPPQAFRENQQQHEFIIENRVKVVYGGFDDREDIQRFNSAEYCFAFIDQAEEISQTEFGMVLATLRRKLHGKALVPKVLLTANPAKCWLKTEFVDKPRDSGPWRFLRALPTDNPFLPPGYVENLTASQ